MKKASASMPPQVDRGGCTPSPRKLSALSDNSAEPKIDVEKISSGATQLGNMWRTTIQSRPCPPARAATTKSRCRSDITVARAMRVTEGA